MALVKLLFLFAIVVAYRGDWVERQLRRHAHSLGLLLGAPGWWPLGPGAKTASSRFPSRFEPPEDEPPEETHAERILRGARERAARRDARVSPSSASSSASSERASARLEAQWDMRQRRHRGGDATPRDKTLLELVTERRERARAAAERHAEVRARVAAARGAKARRGDGGDEDDRDRRRGARKRSSVAAAAAGPGVVSELRHPRDIQSVDPDGTFVNLRPTAAAAC
jgi:hypothetical protein